MEGAVEEAVVELEEAVIGIHSTTESQVCHIPYCNSVTSAVTIAHPLL